MSEQKASQFNINFENVDHSQAIADYINEKLSKHRFEAARLEIFDVNIKRDHSKGSDQYTVSFIGTIEGKELFVKEEGSDIPVIIDKLSDVLKNKLAKLKTARNFQ